MIYLDRNDDNTYSIRVHNTMFKDMSDSIEDKEFHLLLKNTVTNDVYKPVFNITVFEPYFQGVFTQNISDGEYEYTLYYIIDGTTIQYIEHGLLNIGKLQMNRTVVEEYNPDTNTGDIVYMS